MITTLLLLVAALSQAPTADELVEVRKSYAVAQKAVKNVKLRASYVPILDEEKLAKYQAGKLLYSRLVVIQVLSDDECLVKCAGTVLLVSGVPTTEMSDGNVIVKELAEQHFWCSGTRKLKTVTGVTRTIIEIHPIDWKLVTVRK